MLNVIIILIITIIIIFYLIISIITRLTKVHIYMLTSRFEPGLKNKKLILNLTKCSGITEPSDIF